VKSFKREAEGEETKYVSIQLISPASEEGRRSQGSDKGVTKVSIQLISPASEESTQKPWIP